MAQAFGVMSARRSRHWALRKRHSHMVRYSSGLSYLRGGTLLAELNRKVLG